MEPESESQTPDHQTNGTQEQVLLPAVKPVQEKNEDSGLLKAIRAVSQKCPPATPNIVLCSLPQAATAAAADHRIDNIAYGVSGTNQIEYVSCKDWKDGGDQQSDKKKKLYGHTDAVCDLQFVQNTHLLSASVDCSIRLWDVSDSETSGQMKAVYQNHMYPVWSIAVSPLALYFASASRDTTAKLWTTDRLFPIRVFAFHKSDVNCVKFHPNCDYIATASSDHSVRLWSVNDAKCVRSFAGHKSSVHALAFSPDGQFLASAGDDHCIKIWDIKTSNILKEFRSHTGTITSLEWNSDSTILISASLDQSVRVWDTTSIPSLKANDKKCNPNTSPFSSTPLAHIDTKHRMLRTQFSHNNLVVAFGIK